MAVKKNKALDFVFDKLTNSVENIVILDVDFIGDQNAPITSEEIKIIADYFQKRRETKSVSKNEKLAAARH